MGERYSVCELTSIPTLALTQLAPSPSTPRGAAAGEWHPECELLNTYIGSMALPPAPTGAAYTSGAASRAARGTLLTRQPSNRSNSSGLAPPVTSQVTKQVTRSLSK